MPAPVREAGRTAGTLLAFYAAFALVAWAMRIVEWLALEGLRAVQAFEAVHVWATAGRGLVAVALPSLAAAVTVYVVLVRVTPWTVRQVGWPDRASRRIVWGGLWGVGLAAATLLLCLAGGARISAGSLAVGPYVAVALPVLAGLLAAALLEELLFRGFPLVRLASAAGRVGAAVMLAVAFAGLHVWNPEVSALGLVNIGLASFLLSAVFFSAGGLAAAWGVHVGWNAGLSLGADAPVSGLAFSLPGLAFDPGGREWLTGGPFGPEGGLAATIVLAAAAAWWWRGRLIRESMEAGTA